MGTYVSISIGNFDFLSSKNSFGELLFPFSKADLRIGTAFYEDGEQYTRRYLSTTVAKVKRILDAFGFTVNDAKHEFAKLKTEKLEFIQCCLEEGSGDIVGFSYEDVLNNFTFESWQKSALCYAEILANDYHALEQYRTSKLSISEQFLLDSLPFGEGFWGFVDIDFNIWSVFRVLLDAFPPEKAVILDYTELYESGWCNEYPDDSDYEVPKTIILTEGKFDAEVISQSMSLLYPFMSKFFSFINFSEYKVQGSTNFLTHYLKAFIASGIQNRVIALYDNDSAGLAELVDINDFLVPDNFRILHLPDVELAKNYPTLGPNGEEFLDVNGRACSIELFLGKDVLSENGKLIPIQWKGYVDKTKSYQGEVMQKGLIQSKFSNKYKLASVNNEINATDEAWFEMRILLEYIFDAFN